MTFSPSAPTYRGLVCFTLLNLLMVSSALMWLFSVAILARAKRYEWTVCSLARKLRMVVAIF